MLEDACNDGTALRAGGTEDYYKFGHDGIFIGRYLLVV